MNTRAKIEFCTAMAIFGTIGILRRYIDLPSGALAMLRGFIGAGFLAAYMLTAGKRPDIAVLKRNMPKLCISGAFIGFNWILLFEAYNYTSVATATLCYYMAPVIVMLLSPLVLGERLGTKKLICILAAVMGMIPVSGIFRLESFALSEIKGVLFGLGAAALYACVILMNKRINGVRAMDRTVVQLAAAAVVVTPYTFFVEKFSFIDMNWLSTILVIVAGVVYTGMAYAMYFGSLSKLKAQSVALMSYIDPILAVILSATVLGEPMGTEGWIGAAVVIGAMMASELPEKRG